MNTKRNVSLLVLLGSLLMITSVQAQQAQTAISTDGVVESTNGGFKFPDGTVQVTAASAGPYAIGDFGPAGGWVFHITDDGLHGLEAAMADQSTGAVWGCFGTNIVGANATALGKGARNTDDIIHGCETAGITAAIADGYVSPSGYFDWYLPSKDELNLMWLNLKLQGWGDFANARYSSSSERDDSFAWVQDFLDGNQVIGHKGLSADRVRPVRAF